LDKIGKGNTEIASMGRYVFLLCALCGAAAHADEPMRCGRWVVSAPLSIEELLKKCGEPASKRIVEQDVRGVGANNMIIKKGTTTVEYWTYERGRHAASIVAMVRGSTVKSLTRSE
jgi:hypothetical protein